MRTVEREEAIFEFRHGALERNMPFDVAVHLFEDVDIEGITDV